MFGLGKKAKKEGDAPSTTEEKVSKPKSSSSFDIKELALNHGEKAVVAIIGAAAVYFVYNGTQVEQLDSSRTTENLLNQARNTQSEVVKPHVEALMKDRPVSVNFSQQSARSRQATEASPYNILPWINESKNKSGKRSDPELLAPIELQAAAFMGTIAMTSSRPSAIDSLEPAPELDARGRKNKDEEKTVVRVIGSGLDYGYQPDSKPAGPSDTTRRRTAAETETIVPSYASFVAVTAAIEHGQLVKNYLAALDGASGFDPDRDSPNYLGIEVQRVDLTDGKLLSQVQDADWQPMPKINFDDYEKMVAKWPGTADEVCKPNYVADKLTMDIPPVLISNYTELVDNPKIPIVSKRSAAAGGGGYGAASYGGGYSGGQETSNYGSGYGATSYGNNYGGGAGGPGGAAAVETVDESIMPLALENTKFKMVRFFDFEVKAGHTYAYRVRLKLEDPNYPRAEIKQPAMESMVKETIDRVHVLQDLDAKKPAGAKATRTSLRETPWSLASDAVTVPSTSLIFASAAERRLLPVAMGDKQIFVESTVSAPMVYGEWDKTLGAFVSQVASLGMRGQTFGGKMNENELVDVVQPVSHEIRAKPAYEFGNAVTVADIRGAEPMVLETRDNKLPSETEIVAFEPNTGELLIAREFDDYVGYRIYSFADEKEKKAKDEKTAAASK